MGVKALYERIQKRIVQAVLKVDNPQRNYTNLPDNVANSHSCKKMKKKWRVPLTQLTQAPSTPHK